MKNDPNTSRCICPDEYESAACPLHGGLVDDTPNASDIAFTSTDDRIEALTGMRSTPNTPIGARFQLGADMAEAKVATTPIPGPGRTIDGGPVMLRPAGLLANLLNADSIAGTKIGTRDAIPAPVCICHLYDVGELENCPVHAKKPTVQPAPLQLLLAAVTLIPTQPTTEQWQTIKTAILALVPEPKVTGS